MLQTALKTHSQHPIEEADLTGGAPSVLLLHHLLAGFVIIGFFVLFPIYATVWCTAIKLSGKSE